MGICRLLLSFIRFKRCDRYGLYSYGIRFKRCDRYGLYSYGLRFKRCDRWSFSKTSRNPVGHPSNLLLLLRCMAWRGVAWRCRDVVCGALGLKRSQLTLPELDLGHRISHLCTRLQGTCLYTCL